MRDTNETLTTEPLTTEPLINEILEVIVKHPEKINEYDLTSLSLDHWTFIFKANEEVKHYLPSNIIRREDIQAILVSHGHCRYFSEFKADISSSRNFILLCMTRCIFFSANEINQIAEVFPNDNLIMETAFKSNNFKGILRRQIKKSDIIKYASTTESPNMIMGDFDLYRLPRKFQIDEDFIKQLCSLVPSCYPSVLLLKRHYSTDFVLYMLDKIDSSDLMGWELQQSWYGLTLEQQQNKQIAYKFFSVMLNKYNKNPLLNIEHFIDENRDMLKDNEDLKNYVPKKHVFEKYFEGFF